jgi:hypothetical protein
MFPCAFWCPAGQFGWALIGPLVLLCPSILFALAGLYVRRLVKSSTSGQKAIMLDAMAAGASLRIGIQGIETQTNVRCFPAPAPNPKPQGTVILIGPYL